MEGLSTPQRSAVLQLFGVAAERQLEELSTSPENAEELANLAQEELPGKISVAAGIASARLYIKNDQAKEAWRTLSVVSLASVFSGMSGSALNVALPTAS